MAQQVSILDGEVNRNWHLVDSGGEKHLLTLFHDCMTGARAAMLDYEASEAQRQRKSCPLFWCGIEDVMGREGHRLGRCSWDLLFRTAVTNIVYSVVPHTSLPFLAV